MALVFCYLHPQASKQASKPLFKNKGLLISETENLLLVRSNAMDRLDWQNQAFNKNLLISDHILPGQQFNSSQGTVSLCFEKLYQSNFTAAKSRNGSLRLFCSQQIKEY